MYYICAMWAGGKRQRSGSTVKTAKKSGNLWPGSRVRVSGQKHEELRGDYAKPT